MLLLGLLLPWVDLAWGGGIGENKVSPGNSHTSPLDSQLIEMLYY